MTLYIVLFYFIRVPNHVKNYFLYNIFVVFFLGLRRQKSPKRPKKSSMKRRLHCLKVILWSIKEKWKKRKGFIKPGKHCLPQWNRRKKKKRTSKPGKYFKIHNLQYGPSKVSYLASLVATVFGFSLVAYNLCYLAVDTTS